MNYGEKITSGTDDDVPDWVAMMRHTREGGESPVDEAPDRLAAADEAFVRQCENLSETNREELACLSEDITKIGRGNILATRMHNGAYLTTRMTHSYETTCAKHISRKR